MNYLRVLEIGNTGEDVKILQEKLNVLNFKNEVTGSFGRSTYNAVIKFQKENNIEANGVVDYNTWEELYNQTSIATFSSNATLKLGDKNNEVGNLQNKLKYTLYYGGDINNVFDSNTLTSVKSFQYNNRITADGIVGNDTWFLLNSLYSKKADCTESTDDYYTVVAGDTLYSIAKKFNMSVTTLKEINNKINNVISIGEKLKVIAKNDDYIVKLGDTLYSISKQLGLSVNELKEINNLESNDIYVGQLLKTKEKDGNYYIVILGDTLYSIANKFGTSVKEIININNLESDILYIGQKLLIPTNKHIVKAGETLYSIAKYYNKSVEEIKNKNNLSNNLISIGQSLII